jgi:homocitrate synthase NifV
LFFHGHNDLGMATANSLAAVLGGADGLDVTVNGLGDRAGNTALEQIAGALYVKGYDTGLVLDGVRELCRKVAEESGLPISQLAPVVGEYVYWHRSPSHLSTPGLFEAIDPWLFGSSRKISES